MREEVAKEWTAALRSKKYKQGQLALRCITKTTREDVHCCLGVLADICPLVKWHQLGTGAFTPVIDTGDKHTGRVSFLPPAVLDWAGLSGASQDALSGYNDHHKWDFNQIADHIEKNWRDL